MPGGLHPTAIMPAASPAPVTHRARNDTRNCVLPTEVGSWREAHVSGRARPPVRCGL